jgi:uncharacterized membrane protein YccC
MKNKIIWLAPIALLLLSFLPLPYGYYTFLRITVTGCAGYLAWFEYSNNNSVSLLVAVMTCLMVLFNPIFPIYLPRSTWNCLDFLSALAFVSHLMIVYMRDSSLNK